MKTLTSLTLLFISSFLIAQNCRQSFTVESLSGGNLDVSIGVTDLWWNGNEGQYFFPKQESDKVSAIFAGAFWISAEDPNGELLLAAQQFGRSQGNADYWAGPDGTAEACENWDQVFRVGQEDVDIFKSLSELTINNIPENILKWPASGNPFFEEVNGFPLPLQSNGYADFIDQNSDGVYNPLDGDHPRLNGAKEIAWTVMNDFGNVHTESGGDPLTFQIQVTTHVFNQNQTALDNSSLYKVKIINMANEIRKNGTFSLWIDADLGCSEDDLVGCLPDENLAFFYNEDEVDGSSGDNCTGGVNTYGEEIPVMGIKFLKPENLALEPLEIIGCRVLDRNLPGGIDPEVPFTNIGNPADPNSGATCNSFVELQDRRALISYGYFDLGPNESQEIVFAVTGIENVPHPCPDITPLIEATNEVEDFFLEQELLTSSHNKVLDEQGVKIFPNPVSSHEEITISLIDNSVNLKEVKIFDAVGRLVVKYSDIRASNKNISRSKLDTGVYLVECIGENTERYVKKVVIVN